MDLPTLQLIKDAFQLLREGIGAVKDAKSLLPGPQQEAVSATIEKANTTVALAEVQIAKALGFRLHRCAFPPPIMLEVKTPHGQDQRCPACGYTTNYNSPDDGAERSWRSESGMR